MRKIKVARNVLLTTRDAMLGLIAFTAIAIGVLAQSTSATPVTFRDFLSLSRDSASFMVPSAHATPIMLSAQQFSDAASAVKAAVPVPPRASSAVFQRTGRTSAIILLAMIFTAVVAFNLAFLRHLRHVYVGQRRRL